MKLSNIRKYMPRMGKRIGVIRYTVVAPQRPQYNLGFDRHKDARCYQQVLAASVSAIKADIIRVDIDPATGMHYDYAKE